ncbi:MULTISPECIES: T9SS type A sorting domain-containing protein [Flavobacterium]|uniref:Lipoprotein n=1 Tax=Flavobacterium hankyongi TaxID=1176532 RepID=A0ABP8ZY07_9FLAO|nr:T9SS type A sorting domain-containing protein [Flavobacterium sp. N1846]
MKNKITLIITLIVMNCFSQIPNVEWQYYYGGNSFDTVYDQKQTPDGGYIIVGVTNSSNIPNYHYNQEILLLKINSSGILEWQKSIGGDFNDNGTEIKIASNGDYLISGGTESNDYDFSFNRGQSDLFLMRVNPSGTILWQRTYGGSNYDLARNFIETPDGGFVIGGFSNSIDGDSNANNGSRDFWVIKTNSIGVLEWKKNYGGSDLDSLLEIIKTSDGGYIMTGETYSSNLPNYHGSSDVLVVKTDSTGNLIWQKCFGGSNWDYSSSIIEASDGNFIIGASTQSFNHDVTSNHGGYFDFWVLKINPLGTILWQKTYGGSNGEQISNIIETTDGNYIAIGLSDSTNGDLTSNNGGRDFWLVKISESGNLIWQKSLGVGTNEAANTIIQTSDGGYLVSGQTENSGILGSDVWVIKLSNESLSTNDFSFEDKKIIISPNPVIDYFKINNSKITKVTIISLEGKILKEFDSQENYNISEFQKGTYLVKLLNDSNKVSITKIIKN